MPRNLFQKKNRKGFHRLLAAALPLGWMLLILAVYGIRYHTNDDAAIANIASGAYGPDRVHLVYVNILFGCLLRPFYLLAEGLNWYVILQLGLVWLSAAALLALALQRLGTVRALALFAAVAVPFGVHVVYLFQYVKVSGLCVAAGLVLICSALGDKTQRGRTTLGVGLALAGSLLRFDMFCAVGGLSAAVLLGRFFRLDRAGKTRAVATMLVLFALVFGCKGADVLAYQTDDGWREFRQYNAARTDLSDYKAQFMTEENIFAEHGISDNDYKMLCRWDYYDPDVFPTQRVQQLADAVPGKTLGQAAKDTVKAGFQLIHGECYRYLLPIVLALGVFLVRWNRRLLSALGTIVMFLGELFYLTMIERFPGYVEVPLLLAASLFLLGGFAQAEWRPLKEGAVMAIPLLSAVLLVMLCVSDYKDTLIDSRAYREWAASEQSYIDAMSADKEHLYLLSTESINVAAGLDVWHPRSVDYYSNIVPYGGWLSHAPHQKAALAAYGLERPLVDAVDNPKVYLGYQGIHTAAQYATEHLGVPVQAVKCGTNDFAPYQLVTEQPNG